MRNRYRRRSFSTWAFWTTLIVGGTLYGAHRFDWFPIAFLSRPSGTPADGATAATGDASSTPAPPDGQIEVAQNAVDPQSEPPQSEPVDSKEKPNPDQPRSAKARLLEQRAEGPKPMLHANPATPSTVEPANIDDVRLSRPPFDDRAATTKPEPVRGAIVQTSNVVEEPDAVDPELAAQLQKIDRLIESDDILAAHRELSTIYWSKPLWRREIQERVNKTARSIYFEPQPHYLNPYIVKPNDQFTQFAKRYNVPWQYLAKLNHVDPRKIRPGQRLKVIKGPFSAIVELNRYLLTVHAYGYYVKAYQIGIGKDGATPVGKFAVLNKVTNPQYTDPEGHVIDADDPRNPLGERWLDLGHSYGIHGTIEPNSIGRSKSHGCIRMRNEDVEEVYDMLAVGSEVTIRR